MNEWMNEFIDVFVKQWWMNEWMNEFIDVVVKQLLADQLTSFLPLFRIKEIDDLIAY